MLNEYDVNYWNEQAKKDVNFNSVISPDDKIGLKAGYVNAVNKKIVESELQKLKDGANILDFGCGVGRLSLWNIFKKQHYFGVDQSQDMIEIAKKYSEGDKNVSFASYNGQKLPFNDNSFDCIIAIWVLQHILDDNKIRDLANEFSRILKENGKILIIEQLSDWENFEYLKNGKIYKKHRTLDLFIKLFNEKFAFVLSKKTDGLVSFGLFYKSLNVFSLLQLSFLRYFITWFIKLDGLFYFLLVKSEIIKPVWMDKFILFTKKK